MMLLGRAAHVQKLSLLGPVAEQEAESCDGIQHGQPRRVQKRAENLQKVKPPSACSDPGH